MVREGLEAGICWKASREIRISPVNESTVDTWNKSRGCVPAMPAALYIIKSIVVYNKPPFSVRHDHLVCPIMIS